MQITNPVNGFAHCDRCDGRRCAGSNSHRPRIEHRFLCNVGRTELLTSSRAVWARKPRATGTARGPAHVERAAQR
jgi:hypothetical protein